MATAVNDFLSDFFFFLSSLFLFFLSFRSCLELKGSGTGHCGKRWHALAVQCLGILLGSIRS